MRKRSSAYVPFPRLYVLQRPSNIPDLRHPFINDISNNLPNNIQSSYLRLLLTMNNIFVLRRASLITLHIPGLTLGHSRDASRTRVSRAYVHVSLLEPPHLCFTVQSRSTHVANHWSCCLDRSLMSADGPFCIK
jgi:hypothetical protein